MSVKQILLAEDDKDDRYFFFEFLKDRTDFTLILPVAENGIEILEMLQNSQAPLPDIIILDQNMPKQNGLQTLDILKNNDRYQHIPVILYSTYASESLSEQSLKAGASKVLSKPSTVEGYHKMMNDILSIIP